MDTDQILKEFRKKVSIPTEHRLTLSDTVANVLSVMETTRRGEYVATYQLSNFYTDAKGETSFYINVEPNLEGGLLEVYNRIWSKWDVRLNEGKEMNQATFRLAWLGDEPQLFNFIGYDDVGGNVLEEMFPVWEALSLAAERYGYQIILDREQEGREFLLARKSR